MYPQVVSLSVGYWLELLLLGALSALLVGGVWWSRRFGWPRSAGPMQVLGRLALDAQRSVYLVRVGTQTLVLGVGDQCFVKLGELQGATLPQEPPTAPAKTEGA